MTKFTRYRLRKCVDAQGFPGLESIDMLPNNRFFGYGLDRSPDDSTHPCIPAGLYRLTPSQMATSGHLRALVNDVSGRSGIFWHNCNWASELEGCLATGYAYIGSGNIAQGLADKVYQMVAADPHDSWIEIIDVYK